MAYTSENQSSADIEQEIAEDRPRIEDRLDGIQAQVSRPVGERGLELRQVERVRRVRIQSGSGGQDRPNPYGAGRRWPCMVDGGSEYEHIISCHPGRRVSAGSRQRRPSAIRASQARG